VAAGNTYVAIAEQTLGTAAASVTFSSIPGTYTDLVLVLSVQDASGNTFALQFNGDTSTNYSTVLTGTTPSFHQEHLLHKRESLVTT
jgi:hypothetical protein